MKVEPLSIPGAWVCSPTTHADDRGSLAEWYRADLLAAASGRRFDIVQANHSVSRAGVVRGVHFADVPPGQAKYVYCPVGAFLDIVVDLRVGSPTFGAVDTVHLDAVHRRAVFISEGLGHVLCSLQDGSSATYLVSTGYDPSAEHAISPADPALALPLPGRIDELLMSDKDRDAPSLEQAIKNGMLPSYDACLARYDDLC